MLATIASKKWFLNLENFVVRVAYALIYQVDGETINTIFADNHRKWLILQHEKDYKT